MTTQTSNKNFFVYNIYLYLYIFTQSYIQNSSLKKRNLSLLSNCIHPSPVSYPTSRIFPPPITTAILVHF